MLAAGVVVLLQLLLLQTSVATTIEASVYGIGWYRSHNKDPKLSLLLLLLSPYIFAAAAAAITAAFTLLDEGSSLL